MSKVQFPKEWNTTTVGTAFVMQLGKMLSKAAKVGTNPKPYVANRNVQWGRFDLTDLESMDFTPDEQEKFALEAGDILVCEGGEVGRTAIWYGERPECYFQKAIHRLRPQDESVLPEYMLAYMRLAADCGWLTDYTSQTSIAHLTREKFARFPLTVPEPTEQRRIAEILSTLDEAIERTEGLIGKLQQIKAGLMHDLCTRGVTPTGHLRPPRDQAPHLYKPSPLGWIPNEWEVVSVGSCLIGIDAGKSPECPEIPASVDQWGVLKVGAIDPDGLRESQNKVVLDKSLQVSAFLVREDDLLLSRSNTFDLVGLVCHVTNAPKNLMLSDKTLRLQPSMMRVTTKFLFWALQTESARRQIESSATGTSGSMKNISQSGVRRIQIARPSVEEQAEIADRLDAAPNVIAHHKRDLAKLRQQKQGLMHDLLTGRVRVPVAAAAEGGSA